VALCCPSVLGRRILALLVAVLCIVVRLHVAADGVHAQEEARATAGPGFVCRMSHDGAVGLEGSPAPTASTETPWPWGSFARVALHGSRRGASNEAQARARRGDPKASRGPPSFVVS
jgi:hypothetical protein